MNTTLANLLLAGEVKYGLLTKAFEARGALDNSIAELSQRATSAIEAFNNTQNEDPVKEFTSNEKDYVVLPRALTTEQSNRFAAVNGIRPEAVGSVYSKALNYLLELAEVE